MTDLIRSLAAEARTAVNEAENKLGVALRRLDKLDAALAAPAPAPTPPPPKTPTPAAWVRFDSIPTVPRNYDPAPFLRAGLANPSLASAGDQAAFRLDQALADYSHADPIFGVDSTHLHAWVNRTVPRSDMDYPAIRTEGMPIGEGGPINRTIYGYSPLIAQKDDGSWWVLPPPEDANGRPDNFSIYYKQEAPDHPLWKQHPELVRSPLPRGLRMLGGWKHYPPEAWEWGPRVPPVDFSLWSGSIHNPVQVAGTVKTSRLADLLPLFKPGNFLRWSIRFPRLFGEFADSPNHVDHVAFLQRGIPAPADRRNCGPDFTMIGMAAHPGFDPVDLACSSDLDHPELPRGRTMHGYFLDGWDDEFRERMMTVFDRNLSTSNGDFGDGTALSWRDQSKAFKPGLVPYEPR